MSVVLFYYPKGATSISFRKSPLTNNAAAEAEEAELPEVPVVPTSRPGDLWILGNHRLLCGDATVFTDVERLMDG
ncbi:MAG: hypothetical protein WCN98_12360, partial [Verrucomicrobiaceae bacterium]